jgi:hypothetical protein
VVMVPLFVAIPILICDTSDRYIYMQNWTLFCLIHSHLGLFEELGTLRFDGL